MMTDGSKKMFSGDSVNDQRSSANDHPPSAIHHPSSIIRLPYDPFNYQRRETFVVDNIGGKHVPVVVADLGKIQKITRDDLKNMGYTYIQDLDKWNIADAAADYIFVANGEVDFALPGTLKVIQYPETWIKTKNKEKHFPIFDSDQYLNDDCPRSSYLNFVMIDCFSQQQVQPSSDLLFNKLRNDTTAVV